MTTNPKNSLITLNLGIATSLSLGNKSATTANTATKHNKNTLLSYCYAFKNHIFDTYQHFLLIENNTDELAFFTTTVKSKKESRSKTTPFIKTSKTLKTPFNKLVVFDYCVLQIHI
jgi:type III secretory pathway component EscR